MKDVGLRQKKVLADMARYGGGYWQPSWRLSYYQKQLLQSLEERGLVNRIGDKTWVVCR